MTERETFVQITCTDPSHADRVAKIQRFKRMGGTWILVTPGKVTKSGHLETLHRQDPGVEVHLRRDAVVDLQADEYETPNRTRYTLACNLCSLNVSLRSRRLSQVLNRLADSGVTEVQLGALAGIVERARET